MPRKKKIAEEIKKEIKEKAENIAESIKEEVKELTGGKTKKKKKTGAEKQSGKKVEKEEKVKEIKITKKDLEEKAKKLAETIKEEDIRKKLDKEREEEKEKKKTLVPLEDYIKYGVYIGTKVITPHLRAYVYRRRNDGIAIINTNLIDKKLKEIIALLVKYDTKDFVIVCKREAGWKAVKKFSELTGVRAFTKKYPAGILTNLKLPNFFETEMVFICDPWLDKNALHDAKKVKKKVFALCDTNNYTFNIDFFVPCNNKSGKSIGLIFYLLAKGYLKARGIKAKISEGDFIEENSE